MLISKYGALCTLAVAGHFACDIYLPVPHCIFSVGLRRWSSFHRLTSAISVTLSICLKKRKKSLPLCLVAGPKHKRLQSQLMFMQRTVREHDFPGHPGGLFVLAQC